MADYERADFPANPSARTSKHRKDEQEINFENAINFFWHGC